MNDAQRHRRQVARAAADLTGPATHSRAIDGFPWTTLRLAPGQPFDLLALPTKDTATLPLLVAVRETAPTGADLNALLTVPGGLTKKLYDMSRLNSWSAPPIGLTDLPEPAKPTRAKPPAKTHQPPDGPRGSVLHELTLKGQPARHRPKKARPRPQPATARKGRATDRNRPRTRARKGR